MDAAPHGERDTPLPFGAALRGGRSSRIRRNGALDCAVPLRRFGIPHSTLRPGQVREPHAKLLILRQTLTEIGTQAKPKSMQIRRFRPDNPPRWQLSTRPCHHASTAARPSAMLASVAKSELHRFPLVKPRSRSKITHRRERVTHQWSASMAVWHTASTSSTS